MRGRVCVFLLSDDSYSWPCGIRIFPQTDASKSYKANQNCVLVLTDEFHIYISISISISIYISIYICVYIYVHIIVKCNCQISLMHIKKVSMFHLITIFANSCCYVVAICIWYEPLNDSYANCICRPLNVACRNVCRRYPAMAACCSCHITRDGTVKHGFSGAILLYVTFHKISAWEHFY